MEHIKFVMDSYKSTSSESEMSDICLLRYIILDYDWSSLLDALYRLLTIQRAWFRRWSKLNTNLKRGGKTPLAKKAAMMAVSQSKGGTQKRPPQQKILVLVNVEGEKVLLVGYRSWASRWRLAWVICAGWTSSLRFQTLWQSDDRAAHWGRRRYSSSKYWFDIAFQY